MNNELMKIDVESLKQDATKIALEAYSFFQKYIKPLKPVIKIKANEVCKKCGHDDIFVRYCKIEYSDIGCEGGHKSEVLHKSCGKCQYKWNDRPLDTK